MLRRVLILKPSEILIAEISGKRPGDKSARPTERYTWNLDKVIISNNSEGYETDWPIVNVPQDYVDWYKSKAKTSDNAWYAPMNRSYAIKYAREHGYKYLIQLDDNINTIMIRYRKDDAEYATLPDGELKKQLPTDVAMYLCEVLEETNAGICGMSVRSASTPNDDFIRERYVYSFFAMKLEACKDFYQGDFEDDIEYRLKLKQKKIPMLCVCPFLHGKTAQEGTKDLTGNRKAYQEVGIKRGEHMSILYGDYYQAGISDRGAGLERKNQEKFRHKVKSFKVGTMVHDWEKLKRDFSKLLAKYAPIRPTKIVVKVDKPN